MKALYSRLFKAGDTSHDAERLRARRLNQVATLIIVTLIIRIGDLLVSPAHMQALLPEWSATLIIAVVALWINRLGMTQPALTFMIIGITCMNAVVSWNGEGIYDTALYSFPGILIVAGLLASTRLFYCLMVFMLCFIGALGWLSMSGIRVAAVDPVFSDYYRATNLILILTITGVGMRLVVNDLQNALVRAEDAVTRALQTQSSLEHLAQHDSLTQLPNRTLGRDRIEQALIQARRHQQRFAVLFVDLDHFKTVNDTLGHDSGDLFLKQVAQRLLESMRKTDIVCRQGGDEFLIGITDVSDADAISTAANNLMERMAEPFPVGDEMISVSCSIGIAVFPDDGDSFESLVQLADLSMYQAKESGRNAFRFYDPKMNSSILKHLHLNSSLREALADQQFVLHYQPVVDITTQHVVGAEALIRWQHPTLGVIPPGEFISAAEKSGLIVDIGEWVIDEACRQMMVWQASGITPFVLAVNLSPVQFRRGDIEAVVKSALEKTRIAPGCLEFEITETAMVDDAEKFIAKLNRLKALGVRISIDDFGTGYSNLSYLQRFAVDKLKIDQSFVHRINNGPRELAVVATIIQMAKSLGLSTTAEGIDDETTRLQLSTMGCTYGQGYHFARPMPADEFAEFASRHGGRNAILETR
jgi:diguanylate cyclase